MAKMTTTRASDSNTNYEQPIRLATGMYGAMFARYTEPKDMPKYKEPNKMETKIGISFVITHSANEQRLPKFSEAFKMPTLKMFWDPTGGLSSSAYFEFLVAILDGQYTPEQIIAMSDDDLPDLDDLIGYPVGLWIEKGTVKNKNGLFSNNIKSFLPATSTMKRAIAPLYRARKTAIAEKSGYQYLVEPRAEYEVAGDESVAAAAAGHSNGDEDFDDIPF